MFLIFAFIFAIICCAIAVSKGRNPVGWFFIGFLLGLIGLILILCLSNLKDQAAREAHIADENRRLREQIRQERIKMEALREHTAARLDAHDKHLGLDTRTAGPQLGAGDASPLLANGDANWYYGQNGQTLGPVPVAKVQELIRGGVLHRETLVWSEQFTNWQRIDTIPEFAAEFPA